MLSDPVVKGSTINSAGKQDCTGEQDCMSEQHCMGEQDCILEQESIKDTGQLGALMRALCQKQHQISMLETVIKNVCQPTEATACN